MSLLFQSMASAVSSSLSETRCDGFLSPRCAAVGSTVRVPLDSCSFLCEAMPESRDLCGVDVGQACTATHYNVSDSLQCPYSLPAGAETGVFMGKFLFSTFSVKPCLKTCFPEMQRPIAQ